MNYKFSVISLLKKQF